MTKSETTESFTKVMIVGDVHGDIGFLNSVVAKAKKEKCDCLVQLGDMGYWPKAKSNEYFMELLKFIDFPIYFADGNHEDHLSLKENGGKGINQLYPNVFHVSRGTCVKIGKYKALFMGGASSLDRVNRKLNDQEHYGWFQEEMISDNDIEKSLLHDAIDIVFSHECPLLFRFNFKIMRNEIAQKNCLLLNRIAEKYFPKYWFFGHYHHFQEYVDMDSNTIYYAMHANVNEEIINHFNGSVEVRHARLAILNLKNGNLDWKNL